MRVIVKTPRESRHVENVEEAEIIVLGETIAKVREFQDSIVIEVLNDLRTEIIPSELDRDG